MTTWAFWQAATWRAVRTFCQALTGLLVTSHVSSAFNAPWTDLIGASLLAGLTSLLMSVDRSTESSSAVVSDAAAVVPAAVVTPLSVTATCGDSLR